MDGCKTEMTLFKKWDGTIREQLGKEMKEKDRNGTALLYPSN